LFGLRRFVERVLQTVDLSIQVFDGPLLLNRLARHFFESGAVEIDGRFEQYARLAEVEFPRTNLIEDALREFQQTHVIGDRFTGCADALADLFLRETEFPAEASEGLRLLQAIQVLALQVLDHGKFSSLFVAEL